MKINRLAFVKGLLVMHGIKRRDLAKEMGIHESVVCHVLAGRKESLRVEKNIARALNMSFEKVWGVHHE
jgi:lambda repressor-like predicted transcriptional regulator